MVVAAPDVVEGLLHRGSKMVLGGGSKSFKTWQLADLAMRVEVLAWPREVVEALLRATSKRFVSRVERAEQLADAEGKRWTELELDEQDRYFDLAKEAGR